MCSTAALWKAMFYPMEGPCFILVTAASISHVSFSWWSPFGVAEGDCFPKRWLNVRGWYWLTCAHAYSAGTLKCFWSTYRITRIEWNHYWTRMSFLGRFRLSLRRSGKTGHSLAGRWAVTERCECCCTWESLSFVNVNRLCKVITEVKPKSKVCGCVSQRCNLIRPWIWNPA